jgi:hypothetical protein
MFAMRGNKSFRNGNLDLLDLCTTKELGLVKDLCTNDMFVSNSVIQIILAVKVIMML